MTVPTANLFEVRGVKAGPPTSVAGRSIGCTNLGTRIAWGQGG